MLLCRPTQQQNHIKRGRGTAPWGSKSPGLAKDLKGPRKIYFIYTNNQTKQHPLQ